MEADAVEYPPYPHQSRPAATNTVSAASGSNNYANKLAEKVNEQARHIVELESYRSLCEERILELVPNHPLPLRSEHLGSDFGQTNSGQVPKQAASYILSTEATHRREQSELQLKYNRLEKQYKAASGKLNEYMKQLREVKSALEAKEKELHLVNKKNEKLRGELDHVTTAGSHGQSRLGAMGMETATLGQGGSVKDDGSINAKDKDQLLYKIHTQHRKIEELEQIRGKLEESLRMEAIGSEEQRAYIGMLKTALEARMNEIGFRVPNTPNHSDKAVDVFLQLAHLKGELESSRKIIAQRDTSLADANRELLALRRSLETLDSDRNGLIVEVDRLHNNWREAKEHSERLEHYVKTLEEEKTALLEYVQESVERQSKLTEEIQSQKEAIEATRQREMAGNEDIEKLLTERDSLRERVEQVLRMSEELEKEKLSLRDELNANRHRTADLEDKLSSKSLEVQELTSLQAELLNAVKESKRETMHIREESDKTHMNFIQLQQTLTQTQSDLMECKQHLESQRRALRGEMEASMKGFQNQLAGKSQILMEQRTSMESLQREIDQKDKQITDLSRELQDERSAHAQEQDRLRSEVSRLGDELSLWQRQTEECRNKSQQLELDQHQLDRELRSAEIRIRDLELSLRNMESERDKYIEMYNAEHADRERLLVDFRSIQSSLKQTEKRVFDVEAELSSVSHNFKETEKLLEQEKSERVLERKMMYDEIHSLRMRQEDIQRDKSSVSQSLDAVQRDRENRLRDLDRLNDELKRCHTHIDELTAKSNNLNQVQRELFDARDKMEQLNADLSNETYKREETERELRHAEMKWREAESKMQDLQFRMEHSNEDAESIRRKAETMVAQTCTENKILLEKVQQLETEVRRMEQESKRRVANEILENQVSSLKAVNEGLKCSFDELNQQMEESRQKQLQQTNSQGLSAMRRDMSLVQLIKHDIERMCSASDAVSRVAQSTVDTSSVDSAVNSLSRLISSLIEETKHFERLLTESERKIDMLSQEINRAENARVSALDAVQNLEAMTSTGAMEVKLLKEEIKHLRDQNIQLEKQIRKQEIDSLAPQRLNVTVAEELSRKNREVADMKLQIDRLKMDHDRLEKDRSELLNRNRDITDDRQRLSKELDVARSDLSAVIQKKDSELNQLREELIVRGREINQLNESLSQIRVKTVSTHTESVLIRNQLEMAQQAKEDADKQIDNLRQEKNVLEVQLNALRGYTSASASTVTSRQKSFYTQSAHSSSAADPSTFAEPRSTSRQSMEPDNRRSTAADRDRDRMVDATGPKSNLANRIKEYENRQLHSQLVRDRSPSPQPYHRGGQTSPERVVRFEEDSTPSPSTRPRLAERLQKVHATFSNIRRSVQG
eukprot:GILK01006378.1.p1 GENE.GILK01006378.1~~GILK01006378.1.p1  ORF type:complete len:1431 (-),score=317.00 GILK01006378.1:139-4236(-)